MEKTTNYSMFKLHASNREISAAAVNRLTLSIKAKNLLEYRPILVNAAMEVIDGQHRLEAAKALGLPIYYNIDKQVTAYDMIHLNNNQIVWLLDDYLNFWVKEGKEEYRKLAEFKKTYKLTIRMAFRVLLHPRGDGFFNAFKKGDYLFPDKEAIKKCIVNYENAQVIMHTIKEKTGNMYPNLFSATFVMWLMVFLNHPRVDFAAFMRKLPYKIELVKPCSTGKEYLEIYRRIYNWHNSNPIDFNEHEAD